MSESSVRSLCERGAKAEARVVELEAAIKELHHGILMGWPPEVMKRLTRAALRKAA